MIGVRASSFHVAAIACATIAVLLVGALGISALIPDTAYAGGKTSVWIVKKKVTTTTDLTITSTYGYTSKGLVKSEKNLEESVDQKYESRESYEYNKKSQLKRTTNTFGGGKTSTFTYKKNAKGYVTKKQQGKDYAITYSYNKKGLLSKANIDDDSTQAYTFKNGALTKMKTSIGGSTSTWTWKNDKKGNPTTSFCDGELIYKYTNKYNSAGKLSKVVAKTDNGDIVFKATYTYKKVKVPKSLARMVKGQQMSLINENIPIATAHK